MAPDQQRTVSACQQHSRKVMLLGAARTGCGVLRPSSRLLSSPGALCKRSPSQRHFSAVSSVGNLRVLLPRRAMNCKATAVLLHQYHGLAGMAPGSGAVVLRGAMRSLSSGGLGSWLIWWWFACGVFSRESADSFEQLDLMNLTVDF